MKISEEIKSYIGSSELTDEEFLEHYGMPRRSGRYPWGSGKNDYQHSIDFLGRVEKLREKGWKETPENIEKYFGLSVKEYRMEKTLCLNERRLDKVATAERLRDKEGLNTSQIARKMGVNESTIREYFDQEKKANSLRAKETANFLKDKLNSFPKEKQMIDVGQDTEIELNISRTKLDTALYLLESEGYGVYSNRIPQPTNPNKQTTQKILTSKEIADTVKDGKSAPKEIYNYENIQTLHEYISRDGGQTFEKKFNYPESLDSKRMRIRYADEKGPDGYTGLDKDGIIEIRRGVDDLDLKGSRYSQVRILVDGTHYAKGVAIYSDDMPDGVDVVFNTNKGRDVPMKSSDKDAKQVLKPIKNDPDNPFGSAIKDADQGGQYWYEDSKGNKKLGLINKTRDEGDWTQWKDSLPSQFLSKQTVYMAKKQLDLAKADKLAEYEEIKSLTNPAIKKYYLDKFAESCDTAAVDLKAAALPGQKYHVIIPINSLKDNEIYAPQYEPGSKVALIRYPHAGTFEIPILTVTDKNKSAKKIIGPDSIDAVGITKKVADRLSGADFDGDTVMVIPTHDKKGKVKISSRDQLEELKTFEPKMYQYDEPPKTDSNGNKHYYRNGKEFKVMTNTDNEMGRISNLISDMTLLGAGDDDIVRAAKHSMVVIDAAKHKLDYRASEKENDIASLKAKYQTHYDENGNLKIGGASTIISRAKGEKDVPKRKGQPKVNEKGKSWYDPNKPEGALIYKNADPKDLYYAESSLDKKTGINSIKTIEGKTIKYSLKDKKEREKYDPVMHINKKTGEVTFTNKDGTIKYRKATRTTKSTNMAETDDAMTLVSPNKHSIELLYADYANSMKALANKARIEKIKTPLMETNEKAKKVYSKEISKLEAKLNEAKKNSPKERAALRLSNIEVKNKKSSNPDLKGEDLRKVAQRSLSKYREAVGTISRRNRAIVIDDKEWEAIQAGAISENKLKNILKYTDADSLRERAMPKNNKGLGQAQINRIKAMANSNFTLQQIADKMNISTSLVSKYLKGEK